MKVSSRTALFTESVIREMTRLAQVHGAINLAQGFPDFAAPAAIKDAACRAVSEDVNQYAITWGARDLREAIAERWKATTGQVIDPDRHITVTCGATEAMIATLLALLDPGDEVVTFEPFYENYGPDAILSNASPRFVRLRPPDWSFDEGELRAAFTSKTRAVIVNTPNNPTGKVFTRAELETIAALAREHDAVVITDEIYEHILYDGATHLSVASLPGMADRTVTINGLSKTFSVTGWRVGWTIAEPKLTDAIRKVHDFLTVGAPAPLQQAGAFALRLPESYYGELAKGYARRRDRLSGLLEKAGFAVHRPRGAYYIMAGTAPLGWEDDVAFARHMVQEVGIAVVPGSSFFSRPADGRGFVRFAFSKRDDTFDEVEKRLARLRPRA